MKQIIVHIQDRGTLDHYALKEYVTKGSMQLMSDEDVDSWISCLSDTEGAVSQQQFLQVFVAMAKKMGDDEFKHMVVDLSST